MSDTINTKMTALANAIRDKSGRTDKLTLDEMTTVVQGIEVGVDTTDADATAGDILAGKTAYVDGTKVTGSIETKTASDLIVSDATVTVPAGYYTTSATKSVASVIQATPTISVDLNGLITATTIQSEGYVKAGIESATSQLAFQAAKTITPGTTNQTAVSSGYYTGGNVIVKGDSNLKASNIKSGTSIFGVAGSYEGVDTSDATATAEDIMAGETAYISTGKATGTFTIQEEISDINTKIDNIKVALEGKTGANPKLQSLTVTANGSYLPEGDYVGFKNVNVNVEDPNAPIDDISVGLIEGTLTEISSNEVTQIGNYAFYSCSSLTSVNFPVASYIGSYAFYSCSSLTSVNFPVASYIGNNAFLRCYKLTSVNFPVASYIGNYAFQHCSGLTSVSFPACTSIGSYAFGSCYKLTSVSFPVASYIGSFAFYYCNRLISVSFPVVGSIGNSAFYNCSILTSVSFPVASYIGSSAFLRCSNLLSLYLASAAVCTLAASNAFASTPIGGYSIYTGEYGSIYVPASLVDAYKSATNWAYFADRITAIT